MGASVPTTSSIHRHPSASLPLAPTREGSKNRWSQWLSNQRFWPSHLACLCTLLRLKRIALSWARNYYYIRDGHYPCRMWKLGQGSGTVKTAATFSLAYSWRSFPLRIACRHDSTSCRSLLTEALFHLCSWAISQFHTVVRLCCGLAADSTDSWLPVFLRGRCSGPGLAGPGNIPTGQSGGSLQKLACHLGHHKLPSSQMSHQPLQNSSAEPRGRLAGRGT